MNKRKLKSAANMQIHTSAVFHTFQTRDVQNSKSSEFRTFPFPQQRLAKPTEDSSGVMGTETWGSTVDAGKMKSSELLLLAHLYPGAL